MADSMGARRGARPLLFAVAVALAVSGYIVTRPDESTVFIPFVVDAPVVDSPSGSEPAIDAPPGTLDPLVAWPRHVISQLYPGADGNDVVDVDGDGDLDIATSWEEGQSATITIRPSSNWNLFSAWNTFTVATGFPGMEDAKFGDVDGDGRYDVITACESCQKVSIHFAPTSPASYTNPALWTTITISTAVQNWNQIAIADLNGDGRMDIIAGGRRSTSGNCAVAAKIGVFYGPAAAPRTAGSWTFTPLSDAGWTMTAEVHDIDGDGLKDILVSDRLYLWNPICTNTKDPSLTGIRWLRQSPLGTFTNYRIAAPAGDVRFVGYNPSTGKIFDATTNSPNAKFYVHDKASPPTNQWTGTVVPTPTSFGNFQAASWGDLDGDGQLDVVITASGATGTLSGVLWLKGPAFTQRGELSGPGGGEKWDNSIIYDVDGDGDLDVISTEQNTGLGLVWFENQRL